MKKTIYYSSILVFISFLMFTTSCKNKSADTKKYNEIIYDSLQINEHVQLLEVNDTTLPYSDVNINFLYPKQFKSKEDLSRLQQIFIGTFFGDVELDQFSPQEALTSYMDEYKEEYKSLSNMYYEEVQRMKDDNMPMWYWYYLNLENKIKFTNDSLLSYAVEFSNYTGGAHGSYNVVFTNIDLNNLTTVSEEDIFIPNYQKPLAEIIIRRLMKQNEVDKPEDLLNIGFFNIEEIFPNNNFWINEEGLNYVFNQYEIAPYVMGAIEVFIPFEDLKDILKPENGIEKLISTNN